MGFLKWGQSLEGKKLIAFLCRENVPYKIGCLILRLHMFDGHERL